MSSVIYIVVLVLILVNVINSFVISTNNVRSYNARNIKMEYIPDGLSKAQYEALKRSYHHHCYDYSYFHY